MYREILNRLLAMPLKSQIKIDFDLKKKNFRFAVPIYTSQTELPQSIKEYIEVRQNHTFKPHRTTFQIEEGRKALLCQEVPFSNDLQAGVREEIVQFWQMARRMSKMLSEIATEEKFKTALDG